MAKRFTDTNKYKKPFIRSLKGPYKLLWDYLYHDCDHAGIWIVDFDIAQICIGKDMKVNKSDALKFFNSDETRIIEIDGGSKWFIPSFITFQYGDLNPQNRAHSSVINILMKFNLIDGLFKPLTSSLLEAKDKDKDKDMDKVKDMDKEKTWRNDFTTYIVGLKVACRHLMADTEWIKTQEKFHPNINIRLSVEKAVVNFWATEAGWKHKRSKKSKEIDWKSTLTNAIDLNKVYYDKNTPTTVYKTGRSEMPGKFRKGQKVEPTIIGEIINQIKK